MSEGSGGRKREEGIEVAKEEIDGKKGEEGTVKDKDKSVVVKLGRRKE